MTSIKVIVRKTKGGPGSGNWGHSGRPGMQGGSAPGGGKGGNAPGAVSLSKRQVSDLADMHTSPYKESLAREAALRRRPGTYDDGITFNGGRRLYEVKLSDKTIEEVSLATIRNMAKNSISGKPRESMNVLRSLIGDDVKKLGGSDKDVDAVVEKVIDNILYH